MESNNFESKPIEGEMVRGLPKTITKGAFSPQSTEPINLPLQIVNFDFPFGKFKTARPINPSLHDQIYEYVINEGKKMWGENFENMGNTHGFNVGMGDQNYELVIDQPEIIIQDVDGSLYGGGNENERRATTHEKAHTDMAVREKLLKETGERRDFINSAIAELSQIGVWRKMGDFVLKRWSSIELHVADPEVDQAINNSILNNQVDISKIAEIVRARLGADREEQFLWRLLDEGYATDAENRSNEIIPTISKLFSKTNAASLHLPDEIK